MGNSRSKIIKILCEQFSVTENEISDTTGPGDLARWDSIGQLRLILEIEKQFNVQLSVDEVMSINNVIDIVSVLDKYEDDSQTETKKPNDIAADASSFKPLRLPRTTFWGKDSIATLRTHDFSRVALITGSSEYAVKFSEKVESLISSEASVKLFKRPSGEPHETDIVELSNALGQYSPTEIIAFGGGSTIDIAKLALFLIHSPENKLDQLEIPINAGNQRKRVKFIAIPTTFGSGSEVSSAAAYTKKNASGKSIVVSHDFIPDEIILDPGLGEELKISTIWAGAFDALTHAIEGYASIVSHPMLDPMAVQMIKSIISAMNNIVSEGVNAKNLESLCYSSYYAGIIQNHCSVGLTHSFSHQLSGYGIGHGQANAIFLAPVIEFNSSQTSVYQSLIHELGYSSISSFLGDMDGILKKSSLLTLSPEILNKMKENKSIIIEGAMQDITSRTNPVSLDISEMHEVFNNTMEKLSP